MFTIGDSSLILAFRGAFDDPAELTQSLGAEPTDCEGQCLVPAHGRYEAHMREGHWNLEVPRAGIDVEVQIAALFARLSPDMELWRKFSAAYDGHMAVIVGLSTYNGGFDLSKEMITAISERGLRLVFDIWAATGYPDQPDDPLPKVKPH